MNKELKMGLAAGAVLVLGFAAQIGADYQNTQQIMHKLDAQSKLVQMEVRQSQMSTQKLVKAMTAMQEQQLRTSMTVRQAQAFKFDTITEEFRITEVTDDGFARGEYTQGTGEGIYYSQAEFAKHGAGEVAVGDIVHVKWSREDYINEDWDNVLEMSKIIE